MSWKIRRKDVEYFRSELWKDLRPFPIAHDPNRYFAKHCFREDLATVEASVMLILRERVGSEALPKPVAIENDLDGDRSVLVMERINGIRLFDLLRHLREIEHVAPGIGATETRDQLIVRARERLCDVQGHLMDLGSVFAASTYPLEAKLTGLLELFIRMLNVRIGDEWRSELEEFVGYWDSECAMIPFRDATTKNMFIADDRLGDSNVDDFDGEQRRIITSLLTSEPTGYWSSVPLVDVDFSSVIHLTSIEDDPISLCSHEMTFDGEALSPGYFVLDSSLGEPDPFRCCASFLVRYLRFGGRKLAYMLINSQGYKIRFAYDDPLFYFASLRAICDRLDPSFCASFPHIIALVETIGECVANAGPADRQQLAVDHLRRFFPTAQFWQQTPGEFQR